MNKLILSLLCAVGFLANAEQLGWEGHTLTFRNMSKNAVEVSAVGISLLPHSTLSNINAITVAFQFTCKPNESKQFSFVDQKSLLNNPMVLGTSSHNFTINNKKMASLLNGKVLKKLKSHIQYVSHDCCCGQNLDENNLEFWPEISSIVEKSENFEELIRGFAKTIEFCITLHVKEKSEYPTTITKGFIYTTTKKVGRNHTFVMKDEAVDQCPCNHGIEDKASRIQIEEVK